ncbi:MAG: nucleoside transporter [Phycisphaerae bacterium]|nr:nucleoside transporter [Phycisphaerae bacterium]
MPTPESDAAIKSLDKLYEFEREPIPRNKLQPARHFAALLAGEHVAGTEFVIGAMFVAWGVGTYDVIVGLLLGNLMAVLTWTLICTPIAIQTRLTLYWYLRKIAGPVTTIIYNLANAALFCILAGCMITVSASSVRILFGIPAQTNWYPEDFRFVILVLALGSVVVTLAVLGFKRLAQFAQICAPWMFLMFLGGGLVLLPGVAAKTGFGEIRSFSDFWRLADAHIWTGKTPDGSASMSFWQVAAFAWICNLAMHGGLSDMALFRYAKGVSCGLTSAFGMFFGHYVAWICAGIMGAATALMLDANLDTLDSGAIAMQGLWLAGGIAVILAGWTTSNPTMYRAGLAFQAVTPGWPRWAVTVAAGAATTIIACFPFVFTKLLSFVGWYGLILMPVGAIVVVEHWIFPRIGFTRYWASRKGLKVSWPALLSWGIAVGVAILLSWFEVFRYFLTSGRPDGDTFFYFLPIWLLTAILYTAFAAMAGATGQFPEEPEEAEPPTSAADVSAAPPQSSTPAETTSDQNPQGSTAAMWITGTLSLACLVACLALPIWVFVMGTTGYEDRLVTFKKIIIVPSIIYLITATIWAVQREKQEGEF